jgi:hypothetical protein
MKRLVTEFSPVLCYFIPNRFKHSPRHPTINTLSVLFP